MSAGAVAPWLQVPCVLSLGRGSQVAPSVIVWIAVYMVDLVNRIGIRHHLPDDAVDGDKPSVNADLTMAASVEGADLVAGIPRIECPIFPSCGRSRFPN